MAEDIGRVLAPNGQRYVGHKATQGSPYIYAYGHRVYGVLGGPVFNPATGRTDRAFTPIGKWAFCVRATPVLDTRTEAVMAQSV